MGTHGACAWLTTYGVSLALMLTTYSGFSLTVCSVCTAVHTSHTYTCVCGVGRMARGALYSFEYALCVLHNTPMRVYVSLVCVFVDFIAFRRTAVVRITRLSCDSAATRKKS